MGGEECAPDHDVGEITFADISVGGPALGRVNKWICGVWG